MVWDATYTLWSEAALMLLGVGAVGGFLSGLMGVGGGIIFVPAMVFVLSFVGLESEHTMHMVVGSSLAIVLATVMTSARAQFKRDSVDMGIVKSWGIFLTSGVVIGAFFASMVDGDMLKRIFACIAAAIVIYMALASDKPDGYRPRFLTVWVQQLFCFIIGLAASMAGMGGAILTVPMMSAIGIPMHRAAGTSSSLGICVALPGVIGYIVTGWPQMDTLPAFSLGYVNLALVGLVIPASMLMAPVGVRVAHKLDRKLLRRIFAAVLLLVSIRMFMTL